MAVVRRFCPYLFVMFSGLVAELSWADLARPSGLTAAGFDSRIDLVWDRVDDTDESSFHVYRSPTHAGPWTRLTEAPHSIHVFSDFIGKNGQTYFYRVTVARGDEESEPSVAAEATTRELTREEFLDSIQLACLRYFWEFGHPVSGLAREGFLHPRATVTTGGSGFGMLTIMVAAERGFIARQAAAERLLQMTRFLEEKAERYHGMWAHHLNGATGKTIPFAGREDDGGDIVESAFLFQALLTIQEYFQEPNATETELRQRITRLWHEAEWSWYLQPGDKRLTWHWSQTHGFAKNHKFNGFNECMIAYLLAMASPTHPIPIDCYTEGWIHPAEKYVLGQQYYDIVQPVGRPLGGPLFFTQYSYLCLSPRAISDQVTNYFESNRAITRIHYRYAIDNPHNHRGYGADAWGLTSSQNPRGYKAHQPSLTNARLDDGTLAPTAAISAFPYTPAESMAALRHYYFELGDQTWGAFGFYDAFNLEQEWVSPSFLAIDQGPMTPMIENHRTGLPWRMFMRSATADVILEKLKQIRESN